MKYCGNCGNSLNTRAKFCTECGYEVGAVDSKSSFEPQLIEYNEQVREPKLDVFETFSHTIKNSFKLKARASRREYWLFFFLNFAIAMIFALLEGAFDLFPGTEDSVTANIYNLIILIPTISVGVRRMHDTDRSGWWLLFPFVNLYLTLQPSTEEKNKYGEKPSF